MIDYEGDTLQQLDATLDILIQDINPTVLRRIKANWNPVYRLPNRYPVAYKRIQNRR